MTQQFADGALLGNAQIVDAEPALADAKVIEAAVIGDGLVYKFKKGLLASCNWLAADVLLEGREQCVFSLTLHEADGERTAEMHFGVLNWCQARVRIPLKFVDQNRWMHDREGAWLKPCATGKHVSLANVDRMTFTVLRIGTTVPIRWHMAPLVASVEEPEKLRDPLLPKGPLIDALGQSTLHEWAGRTRGAEVVVARLQKQLAEAPAQRWPESFSRWGGWKAGPRQEPTGAFRTYHDGKRWWLVDPEGYLFWSAGMDCVSPRAEANFEGLRDALAWLPPTDGEFAGAFRNKERRSPHFFSYSVANFIRAFGAEKWEQHWQTIVVAQLRSFGMNTMANWSDWRVAKAAAFPYVRPLNEHFPTTPLVFRDFPDVWHPNFAADCAVYAEQLRETLGNPAMIGYFLMNEPTWGFAAETPAMGMLFNNPHGHARTALAGYLQQKYGSVERLSEAWGVATDFADLERGPWTKPFNAAAESDLAAFSTLMVDRLFRGMTEACRRVDPHHMNLGARYYTVPPDWCLDGMTCFDVFSLNAYARKIPGEKYDRIAAKLRRPVLAGEWHFGALDAGLPASGIGHVRSQADRGKAYRVYLEDAAASASCVGVHYFQMYDQNAIGRFDGENYNIGFVDVCGRPYTHLVDAARASHEQMYEVASRKIPPYSDAPGHLPLLFI